LIGDNLPVDEPNVWSTFMSKSKKLLKAGVFGCLMLTFALSAFASDSDRINQLEKDVQELKLRLSRLEVPQGTSTSQTKVGPSSDGWKSLANWRSLKKGMSYDEVRAILGEPNRIEGGTFTHWYFPSRSDVTFHEDKLYSWSEPR
jgi:hypothetical protein